jgi:hypothetical protein
MRTSVCHAISPKEGRCDPFQIVATLKERDVSSQKPLADATKQTQECATARPNPFHRVGMDFANAITIIIAPIRAFLAYGRQSGGHDQSPQGADRLTTHRC